MRKSRLTKAMNCNVERIIMKLLKSQVSYDRIADMIIKQLDQPDIFKIPDREFYIPFIFVVKSKGENITMSAGHCMQNGELASEFIRRKIFDVIGDNND